MISAAASSWWAGSEPVRAGVAPAVPRRSPAAAAGVAVGSAGTPGAVALGSPAGGSPGCGDGDVDCEVDRTGVSVPLLASSAP